MDVTKFEWHFTTNRVWFDVFWQLFECFQTHEPQMQNYLDWLIKNCSQTHRKNHGTSCSQAILEQRGKPQSRDILSQLSEQFYNAQSNLSCQTSITTCKNFWMSWKLKPNLYSANRTVPVSLIWKYKTNIRSAIWWKKALVDFCSEYKTRNSIVPLC